MKSSLTFITEDTILESMNIEGMIISSVVREIGAVFLYSTNVE
jgi:hypothetical protein